MARTVKSLSKKDSTKVLLLTPNNRIEYSENEELPMSKLVSLRNEYSILFTRKFFSNSFAMKLDDEQLEQRVILEGSHIKAREVSLSAWKLNIEWELSHSQIIPHSCHSWLSAIIRVSVGDLKRVLDHKELGSDSMRKVNLDTYERFLCLCIKSVEFVTKVAGQQGYKLLTSDICGLLNIEGCEALHSLVLGYIEVIFSLVNIDKKQLCLRWKLEAIRPFESYLNSLFCTNSSHGELSRAMDIAVRALYQSVLYGDDTWDTILYKHDLRTIVSIEGEYLLRVYYPVWCSKLIDQDAVLRYSQTMKDLFYRCLVRAEIKNEKPFLIQMEPLTWVNTADQDTMSIDRLGRDDIVGRRPRMINNLISMSLSECKSFLKMARQETEDMIATLRRSSISLYHEKYFAHRQLLKMVVSNVNSTWGDDVEGLAWFKSTLPFVSEGATMTSFSSNVVSKMGDLESPSTQTYFVTYFLGVYEKALLESQIPEFEDHFAQLLLSSKGSAALHFFTNYLVPGFIIAGKRRNRLTAPLLNILTRVADSDGNFTFRHVGRRFFYWLPSSMTQDKCIKDALQFMICLIRRHYGTSTDLSEWSQYLFNIVESAIGINNPGGYSSEYRISDRLQSDINAFVDKLKLRNDTHLWEFGNNVIDEKTKISLSLDMAKDFQGEFFVLISLLTRQRFSWLDAMLDAGLKSFFADENQREQVKCAIYPSDRVSTFLESCII